MTNPDCNFWKGILSMIFLVIFWTTLSNMFLSALKPKPAIDQEVLDHLQLNVSPKQDSTTVEAVFTDKTGKTVSISKTFKNATTICSEE